MSDTPVRVTLASGDAHSTAEGVLTTIPPGTRIGRSLGFAFGGMAAALFFLPIPIIHFMAPPALVVTGGVMAVRQFRATARLTALRVPCPKCGAMTSVGGGIGIRHPTDAMEVRCGDCRRGLMLTLEPLLGSGADSV